MLNRIEIIGNCGRDPEMQYTASGKALARVSVAVSRRTTDTGTGERREHTTWFTVVAWDRLAETINEYMRKGSRVYVAGRMESRSYIDKSGAKQTAWEVTASEMFMLDRRTADEPGAPTAASLGDVVDPNDTPF